MCLVLALVLVLLLVLFLVLELSSRTLRASLLKTWKTMRRMVGVEGLLSFGLSVKQRPLHREDSLFL